MRIPVDTGPHVLRTTDRAGAPGVAVVNEAATRLFWPSEGIRSGSAFSLAATIRSRSIGIVGSIRHYGLDRNPVPEAYWSWYQHQSRGLTLVVRTAGSPAELVQELQAPERRILPGLTVSSVRTMDDLVIRSVAEPRFRTLLLALMAVLVLVLTIVGVASLTARAVALRRNEFGIRVALGARPGQIVAPVLGRVLAPVVAGAVIGLLAATWTSRFLDHFLFEVRPADPVVYLAAAALLFVSAAVAAWLPAHRAARLDPTVTLRAE